MGVCYEVRKTGWGLHKEKPTLYATEEECGYFEAEVVESVSR